ncbi:MAG: InlB B-repeat-containing protein, partial [Acidimicrobiales bacterium]
MKRFIKILLPTLMVATMAAPLIDIGVASAALQGWNVGALTPTSVVAGNNSSIGTFSVDDNGSTTGRYMSVDVSVSPATADVDISDTGDGNLGCVAETGTSNNYVSTFSNAEITTISGTPATTYTLTFTASLFSSLANCQSNTNEGTLAATNKPTLTVTAGDTVTFNANDPNPAGATGTMSNEAFTSGVAQALTTNAFADTGYIFAGWNTLAGGGGTAYSNGQIITISASTNLYAQWTLSPTTEIVAFNANSGTGTMNNEYFTTGTSQAITGNAFAFSGHVFTGWNTAANGLGTAYGPGAIITLAASTTLYAQWAATFTVTFNGNGSSFGSTGPQTFTAGVPQALDLNGFTKFGGSTTFTGWNTATNGSGTAYANGAVITLSANLTLNAQWGSGSTTTVTFAANGGSGTTMSNETYTSGQSKALSTNTYTRSGFVFTGWNTASGGTGTSFSPGETITVPANLSLFAQWAAVSAVTFNNNGGSGAMANESFTAGVPQALTLNTLTDGSSTFLGWNTFANGTGTSYADASTVTISAPITLYAQWSLSVTFNSNFPYITGGSGSMSNEGFTSGVAKNLTTDTFADSGYTFSGWNTVALGGGTSYTDGQSVTITSSLTIYAQWTAVPNADTVTFSSNFPYVTGGSGAMSPQSYTSGAAQALTTNAFADTGYTFAGWATSAGGSVLYSNGQVITIFTNLTLYAQWTLDTYIVTFNANYPYPAGGSGVMANETYSYGVSNALTTDTFADTGYTFAGWATSAGGSVVYSDGQSITISATTTLYAQWTAVSNADTVTFTPNYPYVTGGSGATPSETFTSGTAQALTLNGFADTGYTFAGWATTAGGTATYTDGASATVYTNTTLYAKWTPGTNTVTFNANFPDAGGTGTMTPESYTSGTAKSLTTNAFADTGYTFTGWNTAPDGSGLGYIPGQSITIYANLNLYAMWTVTTYTVIFNSNFPTGSSGSGTMTNETYTFGVAQNLATNAYADPSYTFMGWATSAGGSVVYTDAQSTVISANTTLYAVWAAIPNGDTITFSTNFPNAPGGSGTMNPQSYTSGVAQNLTANVFADTGYTFSKWNTLANGTGTSYNNSTSQTFYGNVTLYAQWTAGTDTITFSGNGSTSGSMTNQTFTSGTAQAIKTNGYSKTNYTFAGWGTSPGGPVVYTAGQSIIIYTSFTLYAQWTLNTYTVTFNPNYIYVTGGSGTMSNETYTFGVSQALTFNGFADTGYTFAGWATSANGTATYTDGESTTFAANTTLYAKWTAATDVVTFNSNFPYVAGGSGTMANESYTSGTAKTLSANAFADTGYTFSKWNTLANGTGTSYNNSTSQTFYGNVTLYAQWSAVANADTVTFNGNFPYPAGGSGSTGPETFTSGTAKALIFNGFTDTGYTFAGWATSAGGTVTYTDGASATVYANTTLYANWTANVESTTTNLSVASPTTVDGTSETGESFSDGGGGIIGQSGDGNPQGTVTVTNGATVLCTASLTPIGQYAALYSCALTINELPVGSYNDVVATYNPAVSSSSNPNFSYSSSSSSPAGSFTVTSGPAATATFSTEPSETNATTATSASVTVLDGVGDPVAGDTVTISIFSGPGGGFDSSSTLSATTSVSGIATFTNLVLDQAGSYVLHAADGTVIVNSTPFSVDPLSVGTSTSLNISSTTVTAGPTETTETFSGDVIGGSGDGYPQGTVTIYSDGEANICTATLANDTLGESAYSCSLSASELPVGPYTNVFAIYNPASQSSTNTTYSYGTSTSTPAQTFSVSAQPVAPTVTLNPVTSTTYGGETTEAFSGNVAGISGDGYPLGTVAISVGSSLPATTQVCTSASLDSSGNFTCSLSATQLGAGSYYVVAEYIPAGTSSSNPSYSYSAFNSATQNFTVAQDSTTTLVSVAPSSVTYGSEGSAVFTVTVTSGLGEPVPSGEMVAVTVGSTSCQVTLGAASSGTCSISDAALAPNATPYAVSAAYGGDTDLADSTGTTSDGSTPTTLTVSTNPETTSTSVSIGLTSVAYGNETTQNFNGDVFGVSGDGNPEGTVNVYNGATLICSTPTTDLGQYVGSYTCSPTNFQLLPGNYNDVTAVFVPASASSNNLDFSYSGSTGTATQTFVVTSNPTTTYVSVANGPVTYGNEGVAVFNVTVTPTNSGSVPNGETVTVNVGTASCTAALSSGSGFCSIGASDLPASGTPYSVSATYPTDGNLEGSTGTTSDGTANQYLTVNPDTTTTTVSISVSPAYVLYGDESVAKFTVTVTPGIAGNVNETN